MEGEKMIKSSEQLNYEVELIINENLYKKKIITEDVYKKVNAKLLKLIDMYKTKNKPIINSS